MAFTIETIEGADYRLHRSRRYSQSVAYIRRLAEQFGFAEVSTQDATVRVESGVPVLAKVIVLRAQNRAAE